MQLSAFFLNKCEILHYVKQAEQCVYEKLNSKEVSLLISELIELDT
jgi:hypothetical protein